MRNNKSRAKVGVALVLLASTLGGLVAVSASSATTKAKTKAVNLSGVTLNVGDLGGSTALLFKASNALKGAQYKVNFSTFPSGPPAVAAIQGGSIDLTMTADTPAIFAQAGNVPLKVVAAAEPVNPGSAIGIVIPKGSTITSLSQLKGTKIAVADGTILQYVAIQALNNNDGGFQNATLENLSPPLELSAFGAGSVQAAVLIQPYLAEAIQTYGGTVLASGSKFTKGYDYFLASNAALGNSKKSAAIADYLSRYATAENWASTHETTWAQDYATANNISLSLSEAAVTADLTSFIPIGTPEYDTQANEAKVFQQAGLLTSALNTKLEFSTKFNPLVSTFKKG
jgi:sulfonate transport system substrate-binding protein